MSLRLYTFVNGLYIRPIQFGIQTHHAAQEMMNKYVFDENWRRTSLVSSPFEVLRDWSMNHKTDIVLTAGIQKDLHNIVNFLETNSINDLSGNVMPWAKFHEDMDSLDGILTCVGIVLPESIFNAVNYRTFINTVDDPVEVGKTYDRSCSNDWFWFYGEDNKTWMHYKADSVLGQWITILKNCRFAA